jgi:N-sulfoglucosamine sulfohydrolase
MIFHLLLIPILWNASFQCRKDVAQQPPNIILIIADDVGWNDLGCYGNQVVSTPNIDRIAREGMIFTNAFLTTSSCSPSRCSIITGRYPHNTGAAELHTPLPESQIPFPLLLREAGYYTVQAGKSHFGKPALRCFDRAYEMEEGGVGGEERWVRCLQEIPSNRPFFAWFAAVDAHRDWQHDQYGVTPNPEQITVPPYLVDCPATRRDLGSYYHEISRWDHYIGEVQEELEQQGIAENTVIIIMSDNGMPFPRAKTRLFDSGIKTPLIIRWPASVQPGMTSSALVSAVDIAPTIIDLAGIGMPEYFQGKSIKALLHTREHSFRRYVYAEHNWHDYEAHERMVRSLNYLYIRNNRPELSNGGPADSKRSASQSALDSVRQLGLLTAAQTDNFITPRPVEEIYDLRTDPDQLCNVASIPSLRDTLQFYRHLLDLWIRDTGDDVPMNLTGDGFDRNSGELLPQVSGFNGVKRGEMPGNSRGALSLNAKPGF